VERRVSRECTRAASAPLKCHRFRRDTANNGRSSCTLLPPSSVCFVCSSRGGSIRGGSSDHIASVEGESFENRVPRTIPRSLIRERTWKRVFGNCWNRGRAVELSRIIAIAERAKTVVLISALSRLRRISESPLRQGRVQGCVITRYGNIDIPRGAPGIRFRITRLRWKRRSIVRGTARRSDIPPGR